MRVLLTLALGALVGLLWVGYGRDSDARDILTDVYAPRIGVVPPGAPVAGAIPRLGNDLRSPRGQEFLQRVVPTQAGALWLALVLALAIAVDFMRPRNPHNYELVLLLAPGVLFFDSIHLIELLDRPTYRTLVDLVFGTVVAITLGLMARAMWCAVRPSRWQWQPNLTLRPLAALTAVLLVCNIMTALVRTPDDAGYFVNLGAQRLRERGRLPYGDPLLTGTPGAAYGPVLYAAHVPFQVMVSPQPVNTRSSPQPLLKPESPYYLPPALATKLCTIVFHLVAVVALFVSAARLSGRRDVAWAIAALYCGSPYVLGVGGDHSFIGGLTFVSHIGPAALTLAAFACLAAPFASGLLLALATGAGFYPILMFPAWTAFWWRNPQGMQRFVVGFVFTGCLIAAGTWAWSQPAEGLTRLATLMRDTLGHHTDPGGYGSSAFGFWGQQTGIRAWLIAPLVGGSSLTSPVYVVMFGLVGLSIGIARHGSEGALALMTATIAAAFSLAKVHSTGSYIAWWYGFLLLGLLATDTQREPQSLPSRIEIAP